MKIIAFPFGFLSVGVFWQTSTTSKAACLDADSINPLSFPPYFSCAAYSCAAREPMARSDACAISGKITHMGSAADEDGRL